MVVLNENPTISQVIAMKIDYFLRKRSEAEKRKASKTARTRVQFFTRLMLHIVGFSCFTLAGFSASILAGLIVAGCSCLVLSTLLTNSGRQSDSDTEPRRLV